MIPRGSLAPLLFAAVLVRFISENSRPHDRLPANPVIETRDDKPWNWSALAVSV
jgi:hypothetical protein